MQQFHTEKLSGKMNEKARSISICRLIRQESRAGDFTYKDPLQVRNWWWRWCELLLSAAVSRSEVQRSGVLWLRNWIWGKWWWFNFAAWKRRKVTRSSRSNGILPSSAFIGRCRPDPTQTGPHTDDARIMDPNPTLCPSWTRVVSASYLGFWCGPSESDPLGSKNST